MANEDAAQVSATRTSAVANGILVGKKEEEDTHLGAHDAKVDGKYSQKSAATHCNALQHTAMQHIGGKKEEQDMHSGAHDENAVGAHCVKSVAMYCNTLQHTATVYWRER